MAVIYSTLQDLSILSARDVLIGRQIQLDVCTPMTSRCFIPETSEKMAVIREGEHVRHRWKTYGRLAMASRFKIGVQRPLFVEAPTMTQACSIQTSEK